MRRHVAPALAEQLKKFGDADLQEAISEQQRLETREQEICNDLKDCEDQLGRR